MSGLFDAVSEAIAKAVVDSIEHIEEAECLGFVVEVRSGHSVVRIGSGDVQAEFSRLSEADREEPT